MLMAISSLLKNKDIQNLGLPRVIRSSAKLPKDELRQYVTLVGENKYVREFFDQPEIFYQLLKIFNFSDESKLLFVAYHRSDSEKVGFLNEEIKDIPAKDLYSYLTQGKAITSDICFFEYEDLRKIALESKLLGQGFSQKDYACSHQLISRDPVLSFLATSVIVVKAQRLRAETQTDLGLEVLRGQDATKIRPLEGDYAKEIELFLKVQNLRLRLVRTSEGLLKQIKILQNLRKEISSRKWLSEKISKKSTMLFNNSIDLFLEENKSALESLKLQAQVNNFLQQLRLS
jgi:hypothetical protein